MDPAPTLTRRSSGAIEPIHAIVHFAAEPAGARKIGPWLHFARSAIRART